MNALTRIVLIGMLALSATGGKGETVEPTPAKPGARKRTFQDLKPEERELLRQKRQQFNQLPPEEREKVRRQYQAWKQLSPEEQQKLRQKSRQIAEGRVKRLPDPTPEFRQQVESQYRIWTQLQPDQQRMLMRMHQRAQSAPPDQRRSIHEKLRKFQQLPPEVQRQKLQQMSERRERGRQPRQDDPMRAPPTDRGHPQKPPRRPYQGPPPAPVRPPNKAESESI